MGPGGEQDADEARRKARREAELRSRRDAEHELRANQPFSTCCLPMVLFVALFIVASVVYVFLRA